MARYPTFLAAIVSALVLAACSANVGPPPGWDPDEPEDPPRPVPMDPMRPSPAPSSETCDNGLDEDRDGGIDEGCACSTSETQPCYPGDPESAGVGVCTLGTQTCEVSGEFAAWGACVGAARPQAEICDGIDNDCNGSIDDVAEGCGTDPPEPPPPPPEPVPMDPPPSCRDGVDLSPRFPGDTRSVTASTCGGADIARLFCNGSPAPEAYYVWTSPEEVYAVEWTVSPGYVVGLAQAEESCRPGPFSCEYTDDADYAHTHTLVVERSGGGCGEFTLTVTRTY